MAFRSGQVGRFEKAVSLFLFLVLIAIGGAIFFKQFSYDPACFEMEVLRDAGGSQEFDLALLLPEGFESLTAAESFNADTLYNKINGSAELYLSAGFVGLNCQRFASEGEQGDWAEIFVYDMGSAANAFSVFSVQKRAEAAGFDITRFAYKSGNAIFFARGKYYVEMIAASGDEKLLAGMETVSARLVEAVEEEDIEEIGLFAEDGLVDGSFKLLSSDAFGFAGLRDVFTARYEIGGETVAGFISKKENFSEAESVANRYCEFLVGNGASEKVGGGKWRVFDFYGSIEVVFSKGAIVGGVHAADSEKVASELAALLYENLDGVEK